MHIKDGDGIARSPVSGNPGRRLPTDAGNTQQPISKLMVGSVGWLVICEDADRTREVSTLLLGESISDGAAQDGQRLLKRPLELVAKPGAVAEQIARPNSLEGCETDLSGDSIASEETYRYLFHEGT